MVQSEFSSLPVPRRRKSELQLRPRPSTSYNLMIDTPQTSQLRLADRYSYHALPDASDLEWHAVSRSLTTGYPSSSNQVYTETFSESPMPSPQRSSPAHTRRHSTLTQSVLDGFSAITRRLSVSRKNGKASQNHETGEAPYGFLGTLTKRKSQLLDTNDSSASSTRTKTRGFLSSLSPRRRPSMPILNWKSHSELAIPQYGRTPQSPNMSRPSIPDFLAGGASARAAAAAQNEALANARASPLPTYYAATNCSELGDSESGIGITVGDYRDGAVPTHAVRCDPAAILPPELLESVFSFLDAKSLVQAELVSTRWRDLSRSQIVWRKVFYQEYANGDQVRRRGGRNKPGLGKKIHGQDYRKLYGIRRLIDKRWENGEAAAIYLNGHKDSVYCVQFDEGKIVTGSRDNTVRVWDARTYQCIRKLGPPNNARERVQMQRTEVEPQGVVPFFKMEATSPDPPTPAPSMWHQASVLCLQYDDDILVTGSSDFSCIVWSIKDDYKPMFRLLGHNAGVLDVCIDTHRIVTCSKDTTIKIWDRYTGRLIKTLTGHQGPVNAVQVRGNLLASASGDGMSKLWRMEDGICIKEFHSKERGLACVEFSEDGRTIYAGGNDHVIFQYNTITGNVERELEGHTELVRSLHLDHANNRLVSGSYDHSIKVWDTRRGPSGVESSLKINLEGWTSSWMLAAKSDYRKIACASQDGRVVIVDFGYGINDVNMVEA